MTEPSTPADPPRDSVPWGRLFAIAVGLLIAFLILVGFLMALADSSTDQVWQRRIYLFSAVEAIVFTAVGWLFGREVNRSAVESARQDATVARQTADAAGQEAQQATADAAAAEQRAVAERTRGETVAAVIEHSQPAGDAQGAAPAGRAQDAGAGPAPGAPGAVVDLRALVRDLYRS